MHLVGQSQREVNQDRKNMGISNMGVRMAVKVVVIAGGYKWMFRSGRWDSESYRF